MKATLYFDGACIPTNPGGTATGGVVLIREDGEVTREAFVVANHSTNNVAEWGALVRGIELAISQGVDCLMIYGDSDLVIRQLNRQWKCKKEHLRKFRDSAWKLLDSIGFWDAKWIPREQNTEADRLSGEALTQRTRLPNPNGACNKRAVKHYWQKTASTSPESQGLRPLSVNYFQPVR